MLLSNLSVSELFAIIPDQNLQRKIILEKHSQQKEEERLFQENRQYQSQVNVDEWNLRATFEIDHIDDLLRIGTTGSIEQAIEMLECMEYFFMSQERAEDLTADEEKCLFEIRKSMDTIFSHSSIKQHYAKLAEESRNFDYFNEDDEVYLEFIYAYQEDW